MVAHSNELEDSATQDATPTNSSETEDSETQDATSTNGNDLDSEWQDATSTNSSDPEDSETQDVVTDDVTPWTAEPNMETMPQAETCCAEASTVAILADYDGCWDVISETNPVASEKAFQECGANYTFVKGILESGITSITRDKKVTLFVGSNRQSPQVDKFNNERNQNGLALGNNGAFERWADKYKTQGWSLNKVLLSDGDTSFSSWGNDSAFSWGFNGKDQDLKVRIAENSFKHLNCTGKTDVFFFDDKADVLEHVRQTAKIPQHINVYTVHYDCYSYALEGNTEPLIAKGVDGKQWQL